MTTLPLAVGTALFMTETGGRFAEVVHTMVEAMTELPPIRRQPVVASQLDELVEFGNPSSRVESFPSECRNLSGRSSAPL